MGQEGVSSAHDGGGPASKRAVLTEDERAAARRSRNPHLLREGGESGRIRNGDYFSFFLLSWTERERRGKKHKGVGLGLREASDEAVGPLDVQHVSFLSI